MPNPRGERTGGRGPSGYAKGPSRRHLEAIDVEIKKATKVWSVFERAAVAGIMAVFDRVGYKILFDAVNRCPYETGMLRRSGRGEVQMGNTGSRKTILYVPTADEEGYFEIKSRPITQQQTMTKHFERHGGGRMRMFFSFSRMNEMGQNIAVWAHEELLPFSSRKRRSDYEEETGRSPLYFATKPGTGPKYLDDAIKIHHNELRAETNKVLRKLTRQITTYMLNLRDFDTPTAVEKAATRATRRTVASMRRELGLPTELQAGRVKRRVPRLRRYKVKYKDGVKRRRYFRAPGKPPKP